MENAFKKATEISKTEAPVTVLAIESPLETARILEKEEEKVIDVGIEKSRAEGKHVAQLSEIYPDGTPAPVLEMINKLPSGKIGSYLEGKRAEEKEKMENSRRPKAAAKWHRTREELKAEKAKKEEQAVAVERVEKAKSIEQRKALREELDGMYGGAVPEDVQETFLLLENRQLHALSGTVHQQETTLEKIKEFIVKQHKIAGANKAHEEVAAMVEAAPQQDSTERLRAEIKELEDEAKKPNARKNIESDILSREAELRKLETEKNLAGKKEEAALEKTTESEIPTLTEVVAESVAAAKPAEADFGFNPGFADVEVPVNMAAENAARGATNEPEGIFANPEDAPPHIKQALQEGTRKEWKDRLGETVGKFFESAKEKIGMKSERGEQLMGYLGGRLKVLDEAISVENRFRSMGEKYNKLSLIHKLGIGFGLGVGAAAFTTVSMPVVYACLAGIGVQRAYGLASSFLKVEKELQESQLLIRLGKFGLEVREDRIKEAALINASVRSLLMSVAISEAIEFASDTEAAHAVQRWLGDKLGHHSSGTTHQEVSGKVTEAPAGGISPEIIAIKIPAIHASSHGYEGMLKQLWSQLQDQHLDPTKYPEGSDLRTLIEAKSDSIGGIAHEIALNHQFFHDGTSVVIGADAQMTVGTNGELHFATGGHDYVAAPHEVPDIPLEMTVTPVEAAPIDTSVLNSDLFLGTSPTDVASVPPAHEAIPVPTGSTEGHLVDSSGHDVLDSQGSSVHTGSYEGPALVESHAPDVIINQFGLEIPKLEPHMYADGAKQLFVYGGSLQEQADSIQSYLTVHPDSTVFGTDDTGTYRIPFHLIEGKVAAEGPVRNTGFLSFFSSTFMKSPSPDEFKNLIK
jgi:hypothetical protein